LLQLGDLFKLTKYLSCAKLLLVFFKNYSAKKSLWSEETMSQKKESMSRLEKDLLAATVFCIMIVNITVKDEKTGRKKRQDDVRQFSATAFEKEGNIYRFIAAAHCIGDNNQMCDDIMNNSLKIPPMIYLSKNSLATKQGIYRAKLVAMGKLSEGEDFAVLEAEINDCEITVIPLVDSNLEMGDEVINIATPIGWDKTLFRGYVANLNMDKFKYSIGEDSIEIKTAILCSLPSGPGSSGSAIVSEKHGGIVAILVSSLKSGKKTIAPVSVVLPIRMFKEFWKMFKLEIKSNQYFEENIDFV